ncbi:WRKY transcription factor [Striga asiatica]|uniref:WRKY transcription factor n=1 Tax=Striga asiatica TaxID=4170 RepID=A0A5A7QWP4_STRAF|nr:WRKY transcription factor [Striga asiatica]
MSGEEDHKNSFPYFSSFHNQDQTMHLSDDQGFAFPIITDHSNSYSTFMYNQPQQQQQNPNTLEFDDHHHNPNPSDNSQMSFSNCLQLGAADYNTLSNAFDLSCSSSDQQHQLVISNNSNNNSNGNKNISMSDDFVYNKEIAAAGSENPQTPNSSGSVSSHEGGVEEDSSKGNKNPQEKTGEEEGQDGKSKNV